MRSKMTKTGILASSLLVASFLLAAPAMADEQSELPDGVQTVQTAEGTLLESSRELTPDEMITVSQTQTAEELEATLALSSETQKVQVHLDFDAPGDGVVAAVLVDPEDEVVPLAACSIGAAVYSYHYVGSRTATYGYCAGTWTGSRATLYKVTNNSGHTVLVGRSNLDWISCGYAVCTVSPNITLGYLKF